MKIPVIVSVKPSILVAIMALIMLGFLIGSGSLNHARVQEQPAETPAEQLNRDESQSNAVQAKDKADQTETEQQYALPRSYIRSGRSGSGPVKTETHSRSRSVIDARNFSIDSIPVLLPESVFVEEKDEFKEQMLILLERWRHLIRSDFDQKATEDLEAELNKLMKGELSFSRREILSDLLLRLAWYRGDKLDQRPGYAGGQGDWFPYPVSGANGPLLKARSELMALSIGADGDVEPNDWLARLERVPSEMDQVRREFLRLADLDQLPPKTVIQSALQRLNEQLALPAYLWFEIKILDAELSGGELSLSDRINFHNQALQVIDGPIKLAVERLILDMEAMQPLSAARPSIMTTPQGKAFYQWQLERLLPQMLAMERLKNWIEARVKLHEKRIEELASNMEFFMAEEPFALETFRSQFFIRYGQGYSLGPNNQAAFLGILREREAQNRLYIRGIYTFRAADRVLFSISEQDRDGRCASPIYRYWPVKGKKIGKAQIIFDLDCLPRLAKAELPLIVAAIGSLGRHGYYAMQKREADAVIRKIRHEDSAAQAWQYYAKHVALEKQLLGESNVTELFFHLRMLQFFAAAKAEIGLHLGERSRQEAIEEFQYYSGSSAAQAAEVIDHVINAPGRHLELPAKLFQIFYHRNRAQKALGDQFSLKTFHATLLLGGDVLPDILAARIDHWIEQQEQTKNGELYLAYVMELPKPVEPKRPSEQQKQRVLIYEDGKWVPRYVDAPPKEAVTGAPPVAIAKKDALEKDALEVETLPPIESQ